MGVLDTGIRGLNAARAGLEVAADNIANINTTAFKSNRLLAAPSFSRDFSLGTAPGDTTGGTNPVQIGLGVLDAGTQRNFANGSISATGVPTDVAIEGDGFFIVDATGERFFTRAGAFLQNERNDLVTLTGAYVQGYAVDAQFNIIEGNLVDLNIPVGTLTLAEATRNPLMASVYQRINHVRGHAQWNAMKDKILTRARIEAYNRHHRAIFDAVASRDAEAAVRSITEHLDTARRDLLAD